MTQQLYEGNYAILNMDVPIDRTVTIPGLNGHQGDNERTVPLAIKQGDSNYPYDMTGKYLALAGTDALGVSKIAGDKDNVEKPKFGYVQFKVPAAFYQALGTFTVAYFEVRSVETDEVISSVNVRFDVLEGNKLQMTTGQSEIFNNLTTTAMEYYYRKIKALLEPASNESDRLSKDIEDEIALAAKNGLAVLAKDNTFTGKNTFNGDTILSGSGTFKGNNVFTGTNHFTGNTIIDGLNIPHYTDSWTRNYTLGPGLSMPSFNAFAVSRYEVSSDFHIIWGRGDLIVNHNDNNSDFWETSITMPWKFDSGTLYFGDWHTWKGYFKPYHPANNTNTIPISCSGQYSNEVISTQLLVFRLGDDS